MRKSLAEARASAEEEARLRETGESMWTAERLRVSIQSRPFGSLFRCFQPRTVYARAPRKEYRSAAFRRAAWSPRSSRFCAPATAPGSPMARAMPTKKRSMSTTTFAFRPDNPEYTLRRVWLTKEEEEGYYYGFSNEGLWPLCHIAHTRPIFRIVRLAKLSGRQSQICRCRPRRNGRRSSMRSLLVQDYHFALLPRMIKEARPDVRVAIFWHIPWPNPEAFGICPWQRELLDGLAGRRSRRLPHSGALQQFSGDRRRGPRIAHRMGALRRQTQRPDTLVRPFPISVDFRESQSQPGAAHVSPTNCAPRC